MGLQGRAGEREMLWEERAGGQRRQGLAMLTFSSSGKCVSPGDLPVSGTAVQNKLLLGAIG